MGEWFGMSNPKKRTEILEKKILENIERDRTLADNFLIKITDYVNELGENMTGEDFSKVMLAAAKLVENSQKSNEQIVRIFESLQKKKEEEQSIELNKEEIEKIYRDETVET